MWVRFPLFAICVTACVLPSAFCQPGSGPPDRGRFSHSERELMRQVHQATPIREIMGMLFHEPVRQEIKLSDEKYEAFRSGMGKSFDAMRRLWSDERDGKISRTERHAKVLETMQQMDQELLTLLDEQQFKRLVGLFVQHRGVGAAENGEVARRIELAGEELEEFRRSRSKFRHELIEMNQPRMDRILKARNEDTSRNLERLFAEIDENVNERMALELTETQRFALQELEGTPFTDLPAPRFGWGRGGPPGPGGGRGGRGRPDGRERGRSSGGGGSHRDQGKRGDDKPDAKVPHA